MVSVKSPRSMLAWCALILLSAQASLADLLVQPKVVRCDNTHPVVKLEIKKARWAAGGQLEFDTRLYHLNDVALVPGPTIQMTAGERCNITIVNSLPDTQGDDCPFHENSLHCPDTTNLHTHGLHVSPNDDAVYTHINPGESHNYTYNLPEKHLPGTHWYHAHHHGSTSLQVMGGLAGALIINPAKSYKLPKDLEPYYKDPKVMVFQHVNFNGSDAGGFAGAFGLKDYAAVLAGFAQSTFDANVTYNTNATLKDFILINGQFQPTVHVRANEPTLFRFVAAMGTRTIELELSESGCTMHLIARDGVFQYVPYANLTMAGFVPGTRADILVTCNATLIGQNVTAAAVPRVSRNLTYSTENRANQTLFTIVVDRPLRNAKPGAIPSTQAKLPAYLTNLFSDDTNSTFGTKVEFAGSSLNEVKFGGFEADEDSRYLSQFCLDTVYDIYIGSPKTTLPDSAEDVESLGLTRRSIRSYFAWKKMNKRQGAPPDGAAPGGAPGAAPGAVTTDTSDQIAGIHVYHHHINHFQVRMFNGTEMDPGILRTGEWRDVVPVFDDGVHLRFKPVDFLGEQVIHCHIVEHEDMGMMGLYNITTC